MFNRILQITKSMLQLNGNTGFNSFKVVGDNHWLAIYTNDFEDIEGEILAHDAHERYIKRVKMGLVDMPELWLWHTKGTAHGRALMVDKVGHFVYAIGEFYDTPAGQAAKKTYLDSNQEYRLSHGFTFPAWAKKDGVYEDYNTFEISTLPVGKATPANPYTFFNVKELNNMPISDERKQAIRTLFGDNADEVLNQLSTAEEAGKAFEDAGARFKDYSDVTENNEEDNKSAGAVVDEQTLAVVFEMFGDMSGQLSKAAKALNTFETTITSELKTLNSKLNKLEDKTAKVESTLHAAPRSVQDGAGEEVRDKEAEEELDEQEDPSDGDDFFPGVS